jgi:hypothetical protein
VRARGLEGLKTALRDAKFYGADTALLVPGVVKKEVTFEDAWTRSQEEIRKAIPLAEELGVKIAIEVVWNNFLTKPEQLVKFRGLRAKAAEARENFRRRGDNPRGARPLNRIRQLPRRSRVN